MDNRASRSTEPSPRELDGGFGLLETLAGLVVFMVLAMVGTKAYKGSVATQVQSNQVKALADAVARTSETLTSLSTQTLIGAGSPHLTWSEPAIIGKGPDHFRYRTVPRPTVGGAADTAVVGLEVESGLMDRGAFTPSRTFATLIAPTARTTLGQTSTQAERDAEAAFYASNQARIADAKARMVPENQVRLNSFSCYDKAQCCSFMKEYFMNPAIKPSDGLKEKCLYRCALGGDVSMNDWRNACGMDFCTVAPWKTKEACCKALDAGDCKPGTVCARVCLECVGVDEKGCHDPRCEDSRFGDFFNCATLAFCDGAALPGTVIGWGDVRELCKIPDCADARAECGWTNSTCCTDYWDVIAQGGTPDERVQICATISTKEACCNRQNRRGRWDISCTSQGTANGGLYGGVWYCPDGLFKTGIDQYCKLFTGCSGMYAYNNSGSCIPSGSVPWNFTLNDPWQDPYPPPPRPAPTYDPPKRTADPVDPPRTGGSILDNILDAIREASKRKGKGWGNSGGRE